MPEIGTLKKVEQDGIHIIKVSADTLHPAKVDTAVIEWGGDPYEGAVEITPTEEVQVLSTTGKTVQEDIVINPIPTNYGLITWDGTKITVS